MLWDRLSPKIQNLSRRLIRRFELPHLIDEEDVTVSVFASLYAGLQCRHFPELQDSDGLWRLLAVITVRKVNDHSKIHRAQKRGSGQVHSVPFQDETDSLRDQRPEPLLAAMLDDQCRCMLRDLNDPILEMLVLLKLDGYSNQEIAERLGYSSRTIQRMLNLVRDAWSHYVD